VIDLLAALGLPLLRRLEPERAHRLGIVALRVLPKERPVPAEPRLQVDAFGLSFPTPLGLAAGFDKNAEAPDALIGCGLGFVEVGTVTPRPQQGNPKPRVFRLPDDAALINRLGFNNQGQDRVHERLRRRSPAKGIVGVNIGANRDSTDRIADYVAGLRCFADVASYFTINISSPNTPGLRDLHKTGALDELLARLLDARDQMPGVRRPLLLKISPDLSLEELDGTLRIARKRAIDGLIVSNTTTSRPANLHHGACAREEGGLSGRPLFALSTVMLAQSYRRVDGQFPLIGVGGIESAETAFAKIRAGATLVQVYSSLVFRGPGLIRAMTTGLADLVSRHGHARLREAIGTGVEEWLRPMR
jgi:dihydroorotate dehydrogenase